MRTAEQKEKLAKALKYIKRMEHLTRPAGPGISYRQMCSLKTARETVEAFRLADKGERTASRYVEDADGIIVLKHPNGELFDADMEEILRILNHYPKVVEALKVLQFISEMFPKCENEHLAGIAVRAAIEKAAL